jgi:hypothetical protein
MTERLLDATVEVEVRPGAVVAVDLPQLRHAPGRSLSFGSCGGSVERPLPEAFALPPHMLLQQNRPQLLKPGRRILKCDQDGFAFVGFERKKRSSPRVRVDLEATVKRSANRAGLGLPGRVVVFDTLDDQTTTRPLDDVPSLEVFLRLEDVLRIVRDQRAGLDLVDEARHVRIIA